MKKSIALAALAATCSFAASQSTIVGIDVRGTDHMFVSDTADFVNSWTAGPTTGEEIYAIDFNAAATDLYAIHFDTSDYGTIDITTGVFTILGSTTLPPRTVRGLTAHPDGDTWYIIADSGSDNKLWIGDLTTGIFTSIGITAPSQALIDIACDSQGNLFAHSITTNSLYSLDPNTSDETLIGPIGVNITSAQGMDFDWSTDTLYATLYGNATASKQFVSLDTTTGAILTSVDTGTLSAEMEMAIQVPSSDSHGSAGTTFCSAVPNSTGTTTTLTGNIGSGTGSDLHLEVTAGVPNEFGFILAGNTATPGVMISTGNLCLVGAGNSNLYYYNVGGGPSNSIGRFDAAGILQNLVGTSASGSGFDVPSIIPASTPINITSGSTWHFQAWHRDTPAGSGTSNFSNGLSVTF